MPDSILVPVIPPGERIRNHIKTLSGRKEYGYTKLQYWAVSSHLLTHNGLHSRHDLSIKFLGININPASLVLKSQLKSESLVFMCIYLLLHEKILIASYIII